MGIRTVFGFDMETDIGSWTPWYEGFRPGSEMILRILRKNGITGTFFFTGDAAQKNPEVLKLVRDAGHEIGAHTLFHETIGEALFEIPGMVPVLPEEVENRLRLNTAILEKLSGVRPQSFRCPRLFGGTAVTNALEALGYTHDATYPIYFFHDRLAPYHPSRADWTQKGDMNIIEVPNFADMAMESHDEFGRDRDQWPLWRTESAAAVMEHIKNHVGYCEKHGAEPFICLYMHPWEFHKMPEGLLHYGEGAVLPDPFIIKNCGDYAGEQLDRLIELMKAFGCEFFQVRQIEVHE